jgi:molybdopterin converting factor small subunit
MQITVRLFAQMRIEAGAEQVELDLPEDATVSRALEELTSYHPGLQKHLGACLVAVGLDYVPKGHGLRERDEISLIPPVQGG